MAVEATEVPDYALKSIIQIASDDANHVCALDKDGAVFCWGDWTFGGRRDIVSTPHKIEGLPPVRELSPAGSGALTRDGKTYEWGRSLGPSYRTYEECGKAGCRDRWAEPVDHDFDVARAVARYPDEVWPVARAPHQTPPPPSDPSSQIRDTFRALDTRLPPTDGSFIVGRGLVSSKGYRPVRSFEFEPIRDGLLASVHLSGYDLGYDCFVFRDGKVECTQLEPVSEYGKKKSFDLGGEVVAGSGGSPHSFIFVMADGRVVTWNEQLNPFFHDVPKALAADTIGGPSCALLPEGRVTCWTRWSDGTTNLASRPPKEVLGIINAVQITSSLSGGCALLQSGAVKCWGSNIQGECGRGYVGDELLDPGFVLAAE